MTPSASPQIKALIFFSDCEIDIEMERDQLKVFNKIKRNCYQNQDSWIPSTLICSFVINVGIVKLSAENEENKKLGRHSEFKFSDLKGKKESEADP